jgi:O-antigen/teichoic acid export membrane protein
VRLALNFAVLTGAELVSKMAAAVAFAYLARVLGPEVFGQLEFVLAFVFFFTLLVDTGLSAYGARETAKQPAALPRLVVHVTLLRALLALVSCATLVLTAALIDQPAPVKQLLALYGLTLFGLPGMLGWLFQGREMMRYIALASVLRWSVFTVGIFLVVHAAFEVWLVPVLDGAALACVTLFYLASMLRSFGVPRARIEPAVARAIFRQALPIGASELVWAVKVYAATVLLGVLVSGPEVGWYAAALRVVVALHTFVWLYFFNLLPALSRAAGSPTAMRRVLDPSLRLTAWSAVLIGGLGMALASPVVTLLYGPGFGEAARPLELLIWAIPLTLLSGHHRYALIACGRQQLELVAALVGAALNVGLNLLLIPVFGMVGAACALLVSEAAIWCVAYAFVRRRVAPVPVGAALRMPALTGALMLITLKLMAGSEWWLAAGVTLLVYIVVLSVTQPDIFANARLLLSPRPAASADAANT